MIMEINFKENGNDLLTIELKNEKKIWKKNQKVRKVQVKTMNLNPTKTQNQSVTFKTIKKYI